MMIVLQNFFILLCISRLLFSLMIPYGREGLDVIDQCIKKILFLEHNETTVLAIEGNQPANNLMTDLHGTLKMTFATVSFLYKINTFLIYFDDLTELDQTLEGITRNVYWNLYKKMILVNKIGFTKNNLLEIFKALNFYNIFNVLLVFEEQDNKISLYSYFPFNNTGCGLKYENIDKLANCGDEFTYVTLFSNKIPDGLENCTLNAMTKFWPPFSIPKEKRRNYVGIPMPGLEEFILLALGEMMKLKINVIFEPNELVNGEVLDDNNATGLLGKLMQRQTDIVFGGFTATKKRGRVFDYAVSQLGDRKVYLVPRRPPEKPYKVVYYAFAPNLWLTLCIVIILFTATVCVILRDNKITEDVPALILQIIRSVFQYPFSTSTVKVLKGKLIFIIWLWFILLINSFYQTAFYSLITKPIKSAQLNTLSELNKTKLRACLTADNVNIVKTTGLYLPNSVNIVLPECRESGKKYETLLKTGDMYTIESYLRYISEPNPRLFQSIHVMKEPFMNVLTSIYFQKGFALTREFEIGLMRLQQHGFLYRYLDMLDDEHERNLAKLSEIKWEAVTLSDLTIPFFALIFGTILSTVVFLVEVLKESNCFA